MRSLSRYSRCKALRLDEGASRFEGLREFWDSAKLWASLARYFPRASARLLEVTIFFSSHSLQFCSGYLALVWVFYGLVGLRSNLEIRGRAGQNSCVQQAVETLDVVFCDSGLGGIGAQESSCEHGLGDDQRGRRRWGSCRRHGCAVVR